MNTREGTSENKLFFRSERFVRVNHSYYFQCREGVDQGPFSDLSTAKLMLTRFLIAQQLRKPKPKKTEEAQPQLEGRPSLQREPGHAVKQQPAKVPSKEKRKIPKKAAPVRPKRSLKVTFRAQPVEEYRLGAIVGEWQVQPPSAPVSFSVKDDRFEIQERTLKLRSNEYFDCAADSPVKVDIEVLGPKGLIQSRTLSIEITPMKQEHRIWP